MTDFRKFGLRGGAETWLHSDFTLQSLLNYWGLSLSGKKFSRWQQEVAARIENEVGGKG